MPPFDGSVPEITDGRTLENYDEEVAGYIERDKEADSVNGLA